MLNRHLFILVCCSIFANTNNAKSQDKWYSGICIIGQSTVSNSFVKSNGFPIGRQIIASYGGAVGYDIPKLYFSIFFNYHKSIYSIENSFLLYREYKGYECGFDFRHVFFKSSSIFNNLGGGLFFYGNFDQYLLIKQYMIYPSVGLEFFSSINLQRINRFCVIEIAVPISYSFRQSGNFLNVGISLQIGLKIP